MPVEKETGRETHERRHRMPAPLTNVNLRKNKCQPQEVPQVMSPTEEKVSE